MLDELIDRMRHVADNPHRYAPDAPLYLLREAADAFTRAVEALKPANEADVSPAKNPIADAVHADLAPLASDLIEAGHKLVKEPK